MDLQEGNSKALVPLDAADKTNMKRKRVLDEESHISNMEKIIVRDFFPDLPKLHAQVQYTDAVARKDTQKIWQLQRQYSIKRPTSVTPSVCTATPSTFETPDSRIGATPHQRPDTEGAKADPLDEQPTRNPEPPESTTSSATDVSLDKYLSQNTSEDNMSFDEIMKESEKKHRMKHAWLYDKEEEQQIEYEQNLALPSAEEQYRDPTSSKVQTWKYVAKNALMYVPEDSSDTQQGDVAQFCCQKVQVKRAIANRWSHSWKGMELSLAEKIANAGPPREIVHSNTRFEGNPFNLEKHKESINQAASSKAKMKLLGKVGPDGKEILPAESPKVGGYGFVATPLITPGVDASPLMTWGEIDGTPFRLDGSDTPIINRTPGPGFKIPEVPLRDRCLHELAEKASKAHRAKKQEALKQVRSTFASPSPKFSHSKTDRLLSLSPAAQRLISKKLMINAKSDKALRSSYTPSPGHRLPGESTPIIASSPSSQSQTPTGQHTPKTPSSITDNLLQLPKRPKAKEFF